MQRVNLCVFLIISLLSITVQAETVFVTLEKDNALAVVDPIAGKLVKTIEIGQRPRGITLSPDNNTQQIIKTIRLDKPGVSADNIQPVGVVIDNQRRWGYVAIGTANRVAVINAKTLEVEKYLLVGQRVWNLAFSPDQKRLYTTNGRSHNISMIDLENHVVTKSIGVGRFPWGIVSKS